LLRGGLKAAIMLQTIEYALTFRHGIFLPQAGQSRRVILLPLGSAFLFFQEFPALLQHSPIFTN
jgi:hypothetical protein